MGRRSGRGGGGRGRRRLLPPAGFLGGGAWRRRCGHPPSSAVTRSVHRVGVGRLYRPTPELRGGGDQACPASLFSSESATARSFSGSPKYSSLSSSMPVSRSSGLAMTIWSQPSPVHVAGHRRLDLRPRDGAVDVSGDLNLLGRVKVGCDAHSRCRSRRRPPPRDGPDIRPRRRSPTGRARRPAPSQHAQAAHRATRRPAPPRRHINRPASKCDPARAAARRVRATLPRRDIGTTAFFRGLKSGAAPSTASWPRAAQAEG